MKAIFSKTSIITLLMIGSCVAGAGDHKPVTRIDFNKMIDENNSTRKELVQTHSEVSLEAELDRNDERIKVIDFVDVEVGLGEAPPIVDRRFDSVGEPRIATGI